MQTQSLVRPPQSGPVAPRADALAGAPGGESDARSIARPRDTAARALRGTGRALRAAGRVLGAILWAMISNEPQDRIDSIPGHSRARQEAYRASSLLPH